MTVALPSAGIFNATPRFLDYGNVLEASLGGPDQRLDRVGSRWAVDFTTKPMRADEARVWIARLIRGKSEKASIKFPQPGATLPLDTVVSAAALANAQVIQVTRNDTLAKYSEGVFLSLVHSGKSYVHNLMVDGSDAGAGTKVAITLQPPLRVPLSIGDAAKFMGATIEGYVIGNEQQWTIDEAKIYGLSFTIKEAE